jgi:hypothetical protein
MDFEALARSIGNQFVAVWSAPIPFVACLLLASYVIWKIIQWQYGVRITNLTSQLELYREANAVSAASSMATTREETATLPEAGPPSAPNAPPSPPPPKSGAGERVFVDQGITLRMLRALVSTGTSAAGTAAAKPYLGKWMRLSGEVENVLEGVSGALVVTIRDDEKSALTLPNNNLFFPADNERIRHLKVGEAIKATGKLYGADRLALTFLDCELADEA